MRGTDLRRHASLLVVLAVIAVVAAIRLRLAEVPLERDEGEYAYAGQLILQGVPPYALAWNMKFPGTYYAYALVMALFGQSVRGIHVGLLLVNAAATWLVWRLGRRLIGSGPGAAAAACVFALLSLDRWTYGVFAHATHFVLLPALAGLLLLLRGLDEARVRMLAAAGICLGLAVLMKQHGAAFLLLAAALVMRREWRASDRSTRRLGRHLLALGVGAAMPLLLMAGILAASGVFEPFWFWTITYAREYVSQIPVSNALPALAFAWGYITEDTLALWVLGGAGGAALWLVRWPADVRFVLTGLAVVGALTVAPGWLFRPHYFVLVMPAVALGAGVAMASAQRLLATVLRRPAAQVIAAGVVALVGAHYVVSERHYLFTMSPPELSRAVYASNPFNEAVAIGRYIEAHTSPDDRIAVLGSEPEIYFYARRRSATGYLYTYPIFEPQPYATRMEDEMIREIEAAAPRYVVFVAVGPSWTTEDRAGQDRRLLRWSRAFARSCYDVVGIADIGPSETTSVWDDDVSGYVARHPDVVYTMRRKTDGPCVVQPE